MLIEQAIAERFVTTRHALQELLKEALNMERNNMYLSKCKRMEIITNSLSDHSAIKLELRVKKLRTGTLREDGAI